jgi:hypothetical protein
MYIYCSPTIDEIGWLPGRVDYSQDEVNTNPSLIPPNGNLPLAEPQGETPAEHIRRIFGRMGLNDQEMVAIIGGGHSIGRTHDKNSGYSGLSWTHRPTNISNDFFILLLSLDWGTAPVVFNGLQGNKFEWRNSPDQTVLMFATDFAFRTDPIFNQYAQQYASNQTLFYHDFAKVYGKVLQLGVKSSGKPTPTPTPSPTKKPIIYTQKPYTQKPYTEKPYTQKPYTQKPHTEKPVYTQKATPKPTTPCPEEQPKTTWAATKWVPPPKTDMPYKVTWSPAPIAKKDKDEKKEKKDRD